MGGGTFNSHSDFLKSQKEMQETREYSVSYPAYVEGFQTPSLADETARIENAKGKYPKQILRMMGKAYSQYLKTEIKNCTADEVRFSVKAGQSLLQGKVTKANNAIQSDRVIIELQGRCNEQPLATDSVRLRNGRKFFNGNKFNLTASGCGFCLVNEDSSWIPRSEERLEHSGKGSGLRLLDHMLYIEQSLQNKTAKIEIAPIIK